MSEDRSEAENHQDVRNKEKVLSQRLERVLKKRVLIKGKP